MEASRVSPDDHNHDLVRLFDHYRYFKPKARMSQAKELIQRLHRIERHLGWRHRAETWLANDETTPRLYTHLKTGNKYEVLYDAVEGTNSREGHGVVVYRRVGQSMVYVREASEFHEKFLSTPQDSATAKAPE